jgi:hypothetical protein
LHNGHVINAAIQYANQSVIGWNVFLIRAQKGHETPAIVWISDYLHRREERTKKASLPSGNASSAIVVRAKLPQYCPWTMDTMMGEVS